MAYLFILQHMLSAVLLKTSSQVRICYAVFVLAGTAIILALQPIANDILSYVNYADKPQSFEPIFGKVIEYLFLITGEKRAAVVGYQFFLALIVVLFASIFRANFLLSVAISVSSVAFMLAINNVLRQGTSSVFLLLGCLALLRRSYVSAGVAFGVACGFHISAVAFAGLCIATFWFAKLFAVGRNMSLVFLIIFIGSLGISFFATLVIDGSIYGNYLGRSLVGPERTGLLQKSMLLGVVWLGSEIMLKIRAISFKVAFFRALRALFILFPISLAIVGGFEEIGSRVLYFYYWCELAVVLSLLETKRFKYTVTYIIIGNGFALNVWNILGGI